MIRLLYVVWWESAARNPLLERQVIDLMARLSEREGMEVHLLLADAFRKVRLRDRVRGEATATDLEALRARAPGVRIHCRETWIAPRARRFYASGWVRRHIATGQGGWLRRLCGRHRIDVVHARSYPAAWAVHRSGVEVPWVFDTRGHYPEEGVLAGALDAGGTDFLAWKSMERELLGGCAAAVHVTEAFGRAMDAIRPHRRVVVPTSVDPGPFRDAVSGERRGLVYLGALSPSGWHSPAALAALWLSARDALGLERLLVVSRADPVSLRTQLGAAGVESEVLEIRATDAAEETAALLASARFAALPYRLDAGPEHELVARTMLASKTGEYLAAGLPVLCNQRIGGAGELIREAGAGLLYGPDTDWEVEGGALVARYEEARAAARAASDGFDVGRHAETFAELYRSLVSGA